MQPDWCLATFDAVLWYATDACACLSQLLDLLFIGMDGAGQMQHYTSTDGYNVFRLPVGWQFLTNGVLGGDLDADNLAEYDALVQVWSFFGA